MNAIPQVIEHNLCRLCKSDKLENIFSLGNQFINNFVDESQLGKGLRAPLDLVICNNCSLVQLKHTAPQELLYSRFYWYKSGVTDTMRNALRDITSTIESLIDLNKDDVVLDIGANDGTLLATYINKELIKVGCEPADNLVEALSENCDIVLHDFWSEETFIQNSNKWNNKKAKVITAIGMFYDLDDPNKFISDASKCLTDDGIFIAQLMCLLPMLEKNDLGNICHEHIEYYSLKSLKFLFENNGLEIFKIEENLVNGGSYRIYAKKFKNGSIELSDDLTKQHLLAFKERIDKNKKECVDFIKKVVSEGKKVYVYGASTKGNVILQYYGLDNTLITAAAERSPEKWGKYTIGTWIPIISEEQARLDNPDYFLVLPWAFFDEFYVRESEWRSHGGKFILPLPDFKIVD
jgi:NDP-4-keto-2,6-dideoxyhexose 3-C-methyltransferase